MTQAKQRGLLATRLVPVFVLARLCWSVSELKINNKKPLHEHRADHSGFINNKPKVVEKTWDHSILSSLKPCSRVAGRYHIDNKSFRVYL